MLEPVIYEEKPDNEIDLTVEQSSFILSESKFPLFVAGFGSGKSTAMCISILNDLFNFPGANIAAYAPTYDLLNLITIPYLENILMSGEFVYTLNKSTHIIDVEGYGNIICRSMDNPARIIGYETFRAHCDEFDLLNEIKAKTSWVKIIARNRQNIYKYDDEGRKIPILDKDGNFIFKKGVMKFEQELNRVSAYTTPEGYRFCYKMWEKEPTEDCDLIRASTYSNPHLPEDYIPTLKSMYPAELIEAYLHGFFVNLTGGAVYRKFDRVSNSSSEIVIGNEPLYIGMDFNIEHGAAVVHVLRDKVPHAVDEVFDSYDTDDTIRILDERYPNNPINVYPDATGKKRSSAQGSPSKTDISKLKKAGYRIHVDHSNPLIKDRVNCVNAKILNGNDERGYFINIEKCPHTIDTLEQQIWKNGVPDKSTGLDHIGDALGYFIAKMFPIVRQSAGFVKVKRRA
jgi:hypothetical protein